MFTGRTTASASPKSQALLQIESHGVEVKLHLDLGHAHVATSCKSVEPFEGPEAPLHGCPHLAQQAVVQALQVG